MSKTAFSIKNLSSIPSNSLAGANLHSSGAMPASVYPDHTNVGAGVMSSPRRAPRLAGLDSLRALAVVLVVVYHFLPSVLPGGFVGVDMFFVLSGFLITSLLVQEFRRDSRVSLFRFWQRRARRILPALACVVVVMTAVVGFLGADLLVGLPAQLLGAFTFSSNWVYIATGASYESALTPSLFNNLWSLAVEEQFYVVWPLLTVALFVATSKFSRRRARAVWTCVAYFAAALSAAAMLVLYSPLFPSRVYFGTDTHLFGLMLGAGLAFVLIPHPEQGWPTRLPLLARATQPLPSWLVRVGHGLLAAASLAVIAWACVALRFDSALPFQGGLFAVSLATATLIAVLVVNQSFARVVELRVVSWVGKRSYALYLWHWPVLVVCAHVMSSRSAGQDSTAAVFVVGLIITVVCAALSYRFLEQPVLHTGLRASVARVRAWFSGQMITATSHPYLLSDDALPPAQPDGLGGGEDSSGRKRSWLRLGVAGLVVVALVAGLTAALTRVPQSSSIEDSIDQGAALIDQTRKDPSALSSANEGSGEAADRALKRARPVRPDFSANAPVFVPTVPAGNEITIIGDSVTLAAAKPLLDSLEGVFIDADVSRPLHDAPGIMATLEKKKQLRDFVVIALATNSTARAHQIDEILEAAGDRTVVFVTGHADRSWIKGTNKLLMKAAKEHPNVFIADWDKAVSGHENELAKDGVHPSQKGGARYARIISEALANSNLVKQPAK